MLKQELAEPLILLDLQPLADEQYTFALVELDLLETPDKPPPTEFRIFAFGVNQTMNGDFVFDQESAKSVMEYAAKWRNKFHIDYEHSAVKRPGGSVDPAAPAAAWFKLELRSDGLWASSIEWTKRALGYLKEREYRYFSPAFKVFKSALNKVARLINVGLTNLPATIEQVPLVASLPAAQGESQMLAKLLVLLGLDANTSEESALAKVKQMLTGLNALYKLMKVEDLQVALTLVESNRKKAKKYKKLKKKIAQQLEARLDSELDEVLKAAIKEGRILPADREFYERVGKTDIDGLKKVLKLQKVINPRVRELTEPPPEDRGRVLKLSSKNAKKVQRMLNLSDEQMAEAAKRQEALMKTLNSDDDDENEEQNLDEAIARMATDDVKSFISASPAAPEKKESA